MRGAPGPVMSRPKPTLLVLDPSASGRAAAAAVWSRFFDVVAVQTAASALALMRRRTPALVFTEWVLPDGDGTTFEARVRMLTALRSVPVIFSSSWHSREVVVSQILASPLVQGLDDDCFVALLRGVTKLVEGAA